MSKENKHYFLFKKENFTILITGILVLIIGFMMMSGGANTDPNSFKNDEIFSNRRVTIAPMVCLIGYVIVIVAILFQPKKNL